MSWYQYIVLTESNPIAFEVMQRSRPVHLGGAEIAVDDKVETSRLGITDETLVK
jgi:hypothetical protein